MKVLSVDSVSKVYKTGTFGRSETVAVSDVSFSITGGEIVALIGESGSGKTTLGRMILGLTPVTTGRITFDGSAVSTTKSRDLRQYYRHVQGVFQDPFSSYNPIFKADRVFGMVRRAYFPRTTDSEWDGKLEQALEAVSLNPGDCLHKYPHQLSGGQLQRLLIARALLLDLQILVADEVISMLDASTRVDVLNLLADLSSRGLGIVFITHDLALGSYIADSTVILHRGRIVERGATEKVFGNPVHPYTRRLLDSVPHLGSRWSDQPRRTTADDSAIESLSDGPLVEIEDDHFVVQVTTPGRSLRGL
jgi:ABC-type oligopeptide transport system ATPase subunit